ncbi:MAG: thioesterase family protein [Acidimicrobiales bacterium]|nr:thioesterase family protein [Acidimicrobiales bacterium]
MGAQQVEEEEPSALFRRVGPVLHPTALTRGPWDHGCLHGGAVCGAVGWALEQAQPRPELALARLTVEIRTMVPLVPLRTRAAVVKGGRRTQVIEAELLDGDRVLVRATSQWVLHRPDALGAVPNVRTPAPVPPRPEQAADPGANPDIDYPRPGFNCDAVELRPLRGTTEDEGPGLIWVRLRHPVVEGEHTSPTLAMMTLADFGIAVGWQRSPSGAGVINPDVTLQVNRPPCGEWVLMASRVHAGPSGIGFCETVLSDDAGLFGRILQTLVETPQELDLPAGIGRS